MSDDHGSLKLSDLIANLLPASPKRQRHGLWGFDPASVPGTSGTSTDTSCGCKRNRQWGYIPNGLVALMKRREWTWVVLVSKIVQILPGTVYSVSCHLNSISIIQYNIWWWHDQWTRLQPITSRSNLFSYDCLFILGKTTSFWTSQVMTMRLKKWATSQKAATQRSGLSCATLIRSYWCWLDSLNLPGWKCIILIIYKYIWFIWYINISSINVLTVEMIGYAMCANPCRSTQTPGDLVRSSTLWTMSFAFQRRSCPNLRCEHELASFGCQPKNRGKTPKMDGENNASKPY